MKYVGKTLEEVLEIASKEEYVEKDELVYDVLVQEEGNVEIEVYSIVDVIEYSQMYLKEAVEALGIDKMPNTNYLKAAKKIIGF